MFRDACQHFLKHDSPIKAEPTTEEVRNRLHVHSARLYLGSFKVRISATVRRACS